MKAISAVLATVLIVIIAVALVGLTYSFSIALFGVTTGAGEKVTEKIATGLSSQARVEFMSINDVIIRNTGLTDLSNFTVFINGEQSDFTIDPLVIEPDRLGTIKILDFLKEGDDITILSSEGAIVSKKAPDPCKEAVLCLDMDEGSGTFVEDSSGFTGNDGIFYGENFSDGTIYGAVRVNGKYRKGLEFDGSDDYVRIPIDSTDLDIYNSFSVAMWFNRHDETSTHRGLINFKTSASGGEFRINIGPRTVEAKTPEGYTINLGYYWPTTHTHHFIVAVFDLDNNEVRFYEDGSWLVTGSINRTRWDTLGNLQYIDIGRGYFCSGWNGTIDEVRIFNRFLTQEEIQAEMLSFLPITRPVASYSFEETGQYANDTHIWVKGKFGSALSFDGINDYISTTLNGSFATTGLTVSAWIYALDFSIDRVIIAQGPQYTGNAHWILYVETTNNNIYFGRFDGYKWATYPIQTNRWYHIVGTYNAGVASLYVDGIVEDSESGSMGGYTNYGVTMGMSAWSTGGAYFNGIIDEVRIYNKAIY